MTLYRHSDLQEQVPLEFPEDPDRYQLFFIDDDESEHAPDYDMGPRNSEEPIGEFSSLAFVLNRKASKQASQTANNLGVIQSEEERKALEAEDKRLLIVYCNTVLVNKQTYTVVMHNY